MTDNPNYKEAEKYIRDFRTWTGATGNYPCVEIAAVNGRFTLDFIQPFSSPVIVNAFLKELEDNGITIHTIPCSELSRGRGGPRCMSMPFVRDDLN